MQQFKDMQVFGDGIASQLGCNRIIQMAEIFPDLDDARADIEHQTLKAKSGHVIAMSGVSVTQVYSDVGVNGMEEYAYMQDTVKFRKLDLGIVFSFFSLAEDASLFLKISENSAFELTSGCAMKIKKNRQVCPLSAVVTVGRALKVRDTSKRPGAEPEPSLDEEQFVGTENSAPVQSLKASEPSSEVPTASIQINIGNNVGKKSKGGKKKKSKGRRK